MKLTKGQQFQTKWGVWVYQGIENSGAFKCDKCGHFRKHLHDFLGYTKSETIISNPEGFNYHSMYGTECINDFLKSLVS